MRDKLAPPDKAHLDQFTFIVSMMHQMTASIGLSRELAPVQAALIMGKRTEAQWKEEFDKYFRIHIGNSQNALVNNLGITL